MGLLARSFALVVLVAPACYSPDLRDCTVSCAAEGDCAAGQVCGSDRFCAVPEIAGRCASLPSDGGVQPLRDAASVVDAETLTPPPDAPPDAPQTKVLHIKLDGQGGVSVTGIGICDSAPPQKGDCRFDIFVAIPLHSEAYPHLGWRFDKWTDGPCKDSEELTCDFTPSGPTNLNAKYRRDD
jgi:hypothetical protein